MKVFRSLLLYLATGTMTVILAGCYGMRSDPDGRPEPLGDERCRCERHEAPPPAVTVEGTAAPESSGR